MPYTPNKRIEKVNVEKKSCCLGHSISQKIIIFANIRPTVLSTSIGAMRILKQGAVVSKCHKQEVSIFIRKKLHHIRPQKIVKKNCRQKIVQWASQ